MAEITYEDLAPWQQSCVDLTEALIQLDQRDYFTAHPSLVAPSSDESTVHEFPHASKHMEACNLANRDIKQMVLVNPQNRTIRQCVEQLFDATTESEFTVILSDEREDIFLVRTTAVARIVDKVPASDVPYIARVTPRYVQDRHGSYIHLLDLTFTRQHQTRIYLPIKARPLVLITMKTNAGDPADDLLNSYIGGEHEVLRIGQKGAQG